MIKRRTMAATSALACLVGLSCVAPADAITDNAFNYAKPKTGYYSISTMAFAPDAGNARPWYNEWDSNSLVGSGCFNTRVDLPNGVKITQLRVIYAAGVSASLIAIDRESGMSTEISKIARYHRTSMRVGYTQTLASPFLVDNNKHQIGLAVCVGPEEWFNGARITYTYTTAGD